MVNSVNKPSVQITLKNIEVFIIMFPEYRFKTGLNNDHHKIFLILKRFVLMLTLPLDDQSNAMVFCGFNKRGK